MANMPREIYYSRTRDFPAASIDDFEITAERPYPHCGSVTITETEPEAIVSEIWSELDPDVTHSELLAEQIRVHGAILRYLGLHDDPQAWQPYTAKDLDDGAAGLPTVAEALAELATV